MRPPAPPLQFADVTGPILAAMEAVEGPMPPKKRALVEAAIALFAEHGYGATSTKQIARQAGVAEATIFRHFATKQDLLLRLVHPILSKVLSPAARDQLADIIARTGGQLDIVIKRALLERLALIRRYAPLVRILVQELPVQPELQALFVAQYPQALGAARVLIASQMDAGIIRRDDPDRVLRWIGSLFGGYVMVSTFFETRQTFDDETEIDRFVGLVIDALRPAPA